MDEKTKRNYEVGGGRENWWTSHGGVAGVRQLGLAWGW
jgi:hypothetical protein